jgi:hypothetical protein
VKQHKGIRGGFNNGGREPAEHHDCELCGRPTAFPAGTAKDNRVCSRCDASLERLLRDVERIPDPPGQVSDPNLLAALSMSIVACQMDAEREREEWDRRHCGDRFE